MKKAKVIVLLLFFITVSLFAQEKKYTSYKAEKGETIESLSKKFAMTPYSLLQLNPDIKHGVEEGQLIIVPNKKYNPANEKEHVDYVRDGFLYHKVLAKENYYRLKKNYKVSKRTLRKYNAFLRYNPLRTGDVIKIPTKRGMKLPKQEEVIITDTKFYIVKPKETRYKIARRYGITVDKLEALNPEIKKDGLKMAQVIKVPNVAEIPDLADNVLEYQVGKGETLFSLSQQFGVSQNQLLEMNPKLKDGVKEGAFILIPKLEAFMENTTSFVAKIPADKKLNIIMMLPFLGNKATINFEKDRAINIVTDFYLGALMALDSVKKQGLSVNMKVFDTQNRAAAISTILKSVNLKDVDAIIGPMYVKNIELVSKMIQTDSIALISPVSSKNHGQVSSKNIIIDSPLKDSLQQRLASKVLNFIKKNYKGQNIIVIADDLEENKVRINKITAALQLLDTLQKVELLKPIKGYIKPEVYRKALAKDKENWVVLITKNGVVTADAVNNLGVLPKEIDITLFSLEYGKHFNRVINNYLARLNFHYPVVNFHNANDEQTKRFAKKYESKYAVAPTDYVFKGFDMTYDALLRLASYSSVDAAFGAGVSERMFCKFQYVKNEGKGFENKGVYLIKYNGLDLEKVE